MKKFKKGDKVICISKDNGVDELGIGKTYTVLKSDDDFVFLNGCKYGYFNCLFKKKIEFPKVKELHELDLINCREDINAEKIQEIIKAMNALSKLLEEIYY